jgi:hypothetical protein
MRWVNVISFSHGSSDGGHLVIELVRTYTITGVGSVLFFPGVVLGGCGGRDVAD